MFTEAKRRREKTYVIATRTLRAATEQSRGFRFDGESTRTTRKSIVLYHDKLYIRFCEIELRLLINSTKVNSFVEIIKYCEQTEKVLPYFYLISLGHNYNISKRFINLFPTNCKNAMFV